MYPYHNTIKKRIKNGELVNYEVDGTKVGVYTDPQAGECEIVER